MDVDSFDPTPDLAFRTAVAGFLAPAAWTAPRPPDIAIAPPRLPLAVGCTSWPDFAERFREDATHWRGNRWRPDEWVWNAVQGFFLNGGSRCWIVLHDPDELDDGVAALAEIDEVDLVCAPSLAAAPIARVQQLVRSCEARRDDWFTILDAPRDLASAWLDAVRASPCARPGDVAVYRPWLTLGGDFELAPGASVDPDGVRPYLSPPSGHVAGVFARTDTRTGVHKAPANEAVAGIIDVASDEGELATANSLRALPGRGIRVWGARTLAVPSSRLDPAVFVNVRRTVLTLGRWLVRALAWTLFEANDFRLWVRVHRELDAKLTELFLQGALQGGTPAEAFSIKCDAENNPDTARANGELHIDIRVAPAVSKEHIQIRVIRTADGLVVA